MHWTGDELNSLKEVTEKLEALGIPYVLGGSIASSIHGVPRLTHDADLAVEPFAGKEATLVAQFGREWYISLPAVEAAVRDRSSFNILQTLSGFKVDVFVRKDRPFAESAMSRRRIVRLDQAKDSAFMVLSPEDILLHKLEWYRMGGEVSDRQWSDIVGIIQVQRERLDRAYVEKWSKELGVEDLWARAREQSMP